MVCPACRADNYEGSKVLQGVRDGVGLALLRGMDSSSTDAELLARSVAEPALFAGLYERYGLANPPVASVADSACRPITAPSSTATTESWSGRRACRGALVCREALA